MPEVRINDTDSPNVVAAGFGSPRAYPPSVAVPRFPQPCEIGPGDEPIPALLVGVQLREAEGGVRIEYVVTWWSQGNNVEKYFAPSEVRFPAGKDQIAIGFRR